MKIVDIIEDVTTKVSQYQFSSIADGGSGYYTVIIASRDIQYWNTGMRIRILVDGTYYYGITTAVASPRVTFLIDNGATFDSTKATSFEMDINYKHGHPLDVFNQLQDMAVNPSYSIRRFPVIALMQDFQESLGPGINETPIQIILAVDTKPQWTAAERYTNSYESRRLTAIGERFLNYLGYSRYVYFRRSDCEWIDRLYWGRGGAFGNEANVAGDHIDAIELNIDLKTVLNC